MAAALACPVLAFAAPCVLADGTVVDKLYHPYVDALENELEFRGVGQDPQPGLQTPAQLHQVSLGHSFGQHWFGEVYLIGARSREGAYDLEAVEAEVKWQLTEQGEYFADWGLLFEYERERGEDVQEFTTALLVEKEWGRWSGTANLFLIGEWGRDIDDELETSLSLQARYRYSPFFEPALELYAGQNSRGLGPAVQGGVNLAPGKNLHWEAGLIFGLDGDSPDRSWRFLLEYEF